MRISLALALGLASLLAFAPRPGAAVTLEDCQEWLEALEGEASGVDVSGAEGASERDALLEDLKNASLERRGAKRSQSLKEVAAFRKRAADLTARGRIGRVEGERLNTLSDTVRHCLDQIEE